MSTNPWSPPPAGVSPAAPPPAYGDRRRDPVVPVVLVAAALGLVAFVAVLVLTVTTTLGAVSAAAGSCEPETPPRGAGADAVAYLDAVNRTGPERLLLSDQIEAAGYRVTVTELVWAADIDEAFLNEVRAIDFSPAARPAADAFVAAVEDYQGFVVRSAQDPEYLAAHADEQTAVNAARARAGENLRTALALPQATCMLNRP